MDVVHVHHEYGAHFAKGAALLVVAARVRRMDFPGTEREFHSTIKKSIPLCPPGDED